MQEVNSKYCATFPFSYSNSNKFKEWSGTEHRNVKSESAVVCSLHQDISFLCYSFSNNGVCFSKLKLSVYDVIVNQKVPMETESYNSLDGTIILLALLVQKYVFGLRYIILLIGHSNRLQLCTLQFSRMSLPSHCRPFSDGDTLSPLGKLPAVTHFLCSYCMQNDASEVLFGLSLRHKKSMCILQSC